MSGNSAQRCPAIKAEMMETVGENRHEIVVFDVGVLMEKLATWHYRII